MEIAIHAKVKHGILFRAAQKLGTNTALAEYLGVSQSEIGRFINLKTVPSLRFQTKHPLMPGKVAELLGEWVEWEDLFPARLSPHDLMSMTREYTMIKDVPVEDLQYLGSREQLLLMGPEQELIQQEVNEEIATVLKKLRPREEKIMRLRYGFDEEPLTFDEVGKRIGIGAQRVYQLVMVSLRKLRYPKNSRGLRKMVY